MRFFRCKKCIGKKQNKLNSKLASEFGVTKQWIRMGVVQKHSKVNISECLKGNCCFSFFS